MIIRKDLFWVVLYVFLTTPVLVDERDHQPIRAIEILSHDGRGLNLHDLCWAHAEDIRPLEAVKLHAVA